MPFKSGFITIIGRPNVGKSTLLNRLLGERLAIITEKPQTTRDRILGVKNLPEAQLIFLDTPGIYHLKKKVKLNQYMVGLALSTLKDADLVVLMVEAPYPQHNDDELIIERLKENKNSSILAINKIDLIEKPRLLPQMEQYSESYDFLSIIPISATLGEGIEELTGEIIKYLPEGTPYYPEDILTDKSERFLASEIIREKAIELTGEEIPYCVAVVVEEFKEKEDENLIVIMATIYVERDSQKGIMIGKGGKKLKEIGTRARKEMEIFFGKKIYLSLWVKVRKGWTRDPRALKEFGYK